MQVRANCYSSEPTSARPSLRRWLTVVAFAGASVACGSPALHDDAGPTTDAGPTPADAPHGDAGGGDAGVSLPPSTMMTIPLAGCDPFYTATVTIGEKQQFQLAVDTGSTTLAVAGASCSACAEAGVTPLYEPDPPAVDTHHATSSLYSAGTLGWTGEVYADTVQVGDVARPVITNIAVMQNESGLFQTGEPCGLGEGILGLGPKGASVSGTDGLFDQLVAAGVPDVFAAELCDTNGYLWLGGYDPAHALATPQFTPLVPNELYAVHLAGVSVEGKSLGVPTSAYGTGTTILDTGGSLFFLPEAVFTALRAQVGSDPTFQRLFGGTDWFVSLDACRPMAETRAELDAMMPKLTIAFGESLEVSILATATSSYLLPVPYEGQTYWCPGIGTLPSGSAGDGVVADIGGALLHSTLVIFDRANKRVGFAPHGSCP
jgi:hypothetical protein